MSVVKDDTVEIPLREIGRYQCGYDGVRVRRAKMNLLNMAYSEGMVPVSLGPGRFELVDRFSIEQGKRFYAVLMSAAPIEYFT